MSALSPADFCFALLLLVLPFSTSCHVSLHICIFNRRILNNYIFLASRGTYKDDSLIRHHFSMLVSLLFLRKIPFMLSCPCVCLANYLLNILTDLISILLELYTTYFGGYLPSVIPIFLPCGHCFYLMVLRLEFVIKLTETKYAACFKMFRISEITSEWLYTLSSSRLYLRVFCSHLYRSGFVVWGRLFLFSLLSFFKQRKYVREITTLCHRFQRHKFTFNAIASWPIVTKLDRSVNVFFTAQPYLFLNFLKSVITHWTRVFLSLEQHWWGFV